MRSWHNATARLRETIAWPQRLAHVLAVGLVVAIGAAQSFAVDIYWTGAAGDNNWNNPNNWDAGIVPSPAERAKINGPEAEGANGPLIQEGVEAITEILIADAGNPVMNMTGGRLELTGWGMWWADDVDTVATFNMSGGVIEFTGSPGIFEMAWQPNGTPEVSSVGIWNMTGGEIFAKGLDMPGKGYGGQATINLHGGTINVGLERGGLHLYEGALIDITEGLLVLDDDQTALVEGYAADGWITAYGGNGNLVVEYDNANFTTTVRATPGGPSGDFNANGVLDAGDIDLLSAEARKPAPDLSFDLNSDSKVNGDDRTVWIKDLKQTWVGDADLDGEFNSADFVVVFQAGQYEDAVAGNSTWATGDWNGDTEFDSADFVAAFQDGGYERGPRAGAAAVPEPSAAVLLAAGCLLLGAWRRRDAESR